MSTATQPESSTAAPRNSGTADRGKKRTGRIRGTGGRGTSAPVRLGDVADAAPQVARQLAAEAKVEARRFLQPHHAVFLGELVAGVKLGERTAMNLYPRVAGMLDANEDLADAMREFFAELRVSGREELAGLVSMARSAQGADMAQVRSEFLRLGRHLFRADPRFREVARQVLYGEIDDVDEAVVVATQKLAPKPLAEANGHTNGTNGNGGHA